jgi:hypothetical protein
MHPTNRRFRYRGKAWYLLTQWGSPVERFSMALPIELSCARPAVATLLHGVVLDA